MPKVGLKLKTLVCEIILCKSAKAYRKKSTSNLYESALVKKYGMERDESFKLSEGMSGI